VAAVAAVAFDRLLKPVVRATSSPRAQTCKTSRLTRWVGVGCGWGSDIREYAAPGELRAPHPGREKTIRIEYKQQHAMMGTS